MQIDKEGANMQTLISVIMPIKNGENYMEEAIDSIKKQNLDTEIIVIDDGSTDNTADLAKKKRVAGL